MENEGIVIVSTTVVWEDIIAVVYRTRSDPENKVKILLNAPVVYLHSKTGQGFCPAELAAQRVSWVDEEPFLEDAAEIEVDLDADLNAKLQAWCDAQGVAMDTLVHGVSCFLCNPANREYLLGCVKHIAEELKEAAHTGNSGHIFLCAGSETLYKPLFLNVFQKEGLIQVLTIFTLREMPAVPH